MKSALAAVNAGGVHALAHITGGGLTENLPRVLPEGLGAQIDLNAWDLPPVFKWLSDVGGMAEAEMLKTFNAGVGMVLAVSATEAEALKAVLQDAGETVYTLGTVTQSEGVAYTGFTRLKKRVAILISGGGSNMVSLAQDMTADHPCEPVLVVSNIPDAGGLPKAAAMGIATATLDHKAFGKDRLAFEAALHDILTEAKPDIVCSGRVYADFIARLYPAMGGQDAQYPPFVIAKVSRTSHAPARAGCGR